MAQIDLTGRTALITGAGSRLGATIAGALAQAGADIVIHYATNRSGAEALAERARSLGRKASVIQADLHQREQIERLAKDALQSTGRIDVLVHNAANFHRVLPEALDAKGWDEALGLNVTAPYLLTIALAPALQVHRGVVIALGCVSARRPWKNYIPYSVSKAALEHLVRGLALGLAPRVRVNAIAPGVVLLPEDYDQERAQKLRAKIPLARFGQDEDVAQAVVFLAQNDYITGQVLVVDGGLSLS